MSKLKEISTDEIDTLMKGYKGYHGAIGCLELPKTIKNGAYIINIDERPDGEGTHWVCACIDNNRVIYFDSFGQIPNTPTKTFIMRANKPMFYNDIDYQTIKSQACGYFCIYVCQNFLNGRRYENILKDLKPAYSGHGKSSESILNSYFLQF